VIHHSCDRCKQLINPGEEIRYVVRIEVRAAMDFSELYDDDDNDRDHLMEAHEALERAEDAISDLVADDIYQQRRFDLCPCCYRKFIKNPVGVETLVELNFSDN
jgi:hypothetical protein